jgi:hypothetical protein
MRTIRLMDIASRLDNDEIAAYQRMVRPKNKEREYMLRAIGEAGDAGRVCKYCTEDAKTCIEYLSELRVCLALSSKGEVLGAMSYEYPVDRCEKQSMRIGRLGTSGRVKGVGVELLRFAAQQSVGRGMGFHLWAAPLAHPFYLKAGLLPVHDTEYVCLCEFMIFMGMKLPRAIEFAKGGIYPARVNVKGMMEWC